MRHHPTTHPPGMAANGVQPMTPVTGTLQIPPGMQLVPAVPTSFSSMGPPTVPLTQASSTSSPAQAFGMPAHFGAMAGQSPAQGFGVPSPFGQLGGPSPAQGFNTPAVSSSASVYGTPVYTPQQHQLFRKCLSCRSLFSWLLRLNALFLLFLLVLQRCSGT
jgi:hypothetical protein